MRCLRKRQRSAATEQPEVEKQGPKSRRAPSGETSSAQQSSETALDISSGAASVALAQPSRSPSLADLNSLEQRSKPPIAAPARKRQRSSTVPPPPPSNSPKLFDLLESPHAEGLGLQLDEALATAVAGTDTPVAYKVLKATEGLVNDEVGGFYLRSAVVYNQELSLHDVRRQWNACPMAGRQAEEDTVARLKELAAMPSCGYLAQKWSAQAMPRPGADVASLEQLASRVLSLLAPILPNDAMPALASDARPKSWLAYSEAGKRAVNVRLEGGGPMWVSGYTKDASALQPVYCSLPVGPRTQDVLRAANAEQTPYRRWLVQRDEDACLGTELLLSKWRAEAADGRRDTPLAEVAAAAAVFGPGSAVGATAEVLQEPGQILWLQRQGHCSWASGGFFLCWNVATGSEWPAAALREGRMRSSALRSAAAAQGNPRLGIQLRRQAPLHVLRLLFAAACAVPQVHSDILEGLARHFAPLCAAEAGLQAAREMPQLNAPQGVLESADPAVLRCSCCWGEVLFSYVHLVKRKGEPTGDFCWECWRQRRRIGLEGEGGPPRNARMCTTIDLASLRRLQSLILPSRQPA